MKAWKRRVIGFVSIMTLMLILAFPFSGMLQPDGSVPLRDIVSYCTGDATNDGSPELLAISGDGQIDSGERYGALLLVCDASAEADIIRLGYIPPDKIQHAINLSGIKPMKVQLGDVTGDGVNEVALCVYKTTKFYPDMAKRPFFFDLVEGHLIPVWLGSRLSRPFDDYILQDIDGDAIDEIISIERLESGSRVIAVYDWKGFGFEMRTQSAEFDGQLLFDTVTTEQTAVSEKINAIFTNYREQIAITFRLDNGALVYSKTN